MRIRGMRTSGERLPGASSFEIESKLTAQKAATWRGWAKTTRAYVAWIGEVQFELRLRQTLRRIRFFDIPIKYVFERNEAMPNSRLRRRPRIGALQWGKECRATIAIRADGNFTHCVK